MYVHYIARIIVLIDLAAYSLKSLLTFLNKDYVKVQSKNRLSVLEGRIVLLILFLSA